MRFKSAAYRVMQAVTYSAISVIWQCGEYFILARLRSLIPAVTTRGILECPRNVEDKEISMMSGRCNIHPSVYNTGSFKLLERFFFPTDEIRPEKFSVLSYAFKKQCLSNSVLVKTRG